MSEASIMLPQSTITTNHCQLSWISYRVHITLDCTDPSQAAYRSAKSSDCRTHIYTDILSQRTVNIFCKVNRALLGFYLKTSQKFNLLTNSHDHLDCELDWPSAVHRFRVFFQTWCKLLLTDQAPASRWASSRLSLSNGRKQSCGLWVTRLLMRHNVLLVFGCGRSAGLRSLEERTLTEVSARQRHVR